MTEAMREGELWGRRAAQRAALGAKMSVPAWKTAIERTGIKHGTTVLDLACGSGEFCALAAEAGARATGIDASHEMIRLAGKAAPGAEFHVRALGPLPWPDGTFDVVTAFNALFFAPDPEAAFAEAVRVSRDHVVVCDWHPEHPSDVVTIGWAVRGRSGHRRPEMPEPQQKLTIDIPQEYPDEATMLRAFLSTGGYQPFIESEGEESVAEKIRAAAEPFRTADGGYRLANKYLMLLFRKNEMPETGNQAASRTS
jgi:SAM-dependent methyltransferase